jgi:MarR family 2-MHQ and catechol resistance regulon transcriptional repressor
MAKDTKTEDGFSTYMELVRAADSVSAMLSRQLASFEMTLPQFRILERLLHGGPAGQNELCDHMLSGQSNVSHILARLEAKGYIVRRPKEGYKQRLMIHLTPEGREEITDAFPHQAKLIRAQMSALSAREKETLRRLCRKLSEGDVMKFIAELTLVDAE